MGQLRKAGVEAEMQMLFSDDLGEAVLKVAGTGGDDYCVGIVEQGHADAVD